METAHEQLKEAFRLRKEKKTLEALIIYETCWQQAATAFGEWDGWSYGQCLREQKRYGEALDLCRQIYPKFSSNEMIRQLYAWCIYYTALSGEAREGETLLQIKKAVTAIVQLNPPGNAFTPAVRSIFLMLKKITEGIKPDWREVEQWLSLLRKEDLRREPYAVSIPGRKEVELASELEEWYSWQSKLLLQTGQWEACITVCDNALSDLHRWHYSNDIWFMRRKTAALRQLNRLEEALALLRPLVKKKPEWFLFADLAELTTDRNEALALYAGAAMAPGNASKKIRIFTPMALLLEARGDGVSAAGHGMLAILLRRENNWPVPAELSQYVRSLGVEPDEQSESVQTLLQNFKDLWKKLVSGNSSIAGRTVPEKKTGKIESILPNGEAGFIRPDNEGENIYFLFRNFRGGRGEITRGLKVVYEVVSRFDRKKNRDSVMAVKIAKTEGTNN